MDIEFIKRTFQYALDEMNRTGNVSCATLNNLEVAMKQLKYVDGPDNEFDERYAELNA